MEIPWDQVFKVVMFLYGVITSLVIYSMKRTFVKVESHNELTSRVQKVEDTYATDSNLKILDSRIIKIETAIHSLPEAVEKVNSSVNQVNAKSRELEQTCNHLRELVRIIERPVNLIVEAAMKGD